MTKVIIELNVLEALFAAVKNSIHPNKTLQQVEDFINAIKAAVQPWAEQKTEPDKV